MTDSLNPLNSLPPGGGGSGGGRTAPDIGLDEDQVPPQWTAFIRINADFYRR
jgi:hypothetical protein